MHQSFEDDDHEYLDELAAVEQKAARRAIQARDEKLWKTMTRTLELLDRKREEITMRERRIVELLRRSRW